ncbi:MAG: transposase [Actinomycetota bacterium]|nr:transposase [Actinomycetota bacterium]
MDVRTGFLDCFTHAGGRRQAKSVEVKRNILSVLIAMSTKPWPGQDERGLRHPLRRAGLDRRVRSFFNAAKNDSAIALS